MENHLENQRRECEERIASDCGVPGLIVAADLIRSAYPGLSEESIARILGLTTQSDHQTECVLTAQDEKARG
jgi:hypothetical protein